MDGASAKSYAVADRILFELLRNPDKNTLCIREIQKSIKNSSKKLIEDRIAHHNLYQYFEVLETEIRCKHGRGVMIFSGLQTHTADTLKSLENFSLVWAEEAMTLSQKSLEILIPTIRSDDSMLFFTWNPSLRTDPIERLERSKKDAIKIHINYKDNPFCPDVIKREAEEMYLEDPEKYNHIYLGGYVDTTGNKLFSYKDIDRAMSRKSEPTGATIVGVDVARMGDDSTVLCVRSGLWVKSILQKRKMLVTEVADWAGHIADIVSADALAVDTIGLGAGVHDILQRKGYFSIDANFGMRASDEKHYVNKRAESYFKLSKAFKAGLCIPENPDLMEELLAIEYEFGDTNGKLKIISKDKIKELLGRSPDLADALALTYFTDVLTSDDKGSLPENWSPPNVY